MVALQTTDEQDDMVPAAKGEEMTCRVYRHFDEAGTLLYVGIAACALRRLDQHRLRSKWFGDVRRVHIDPCESREEALRLEQIAIKHERPLYNGPVGRPRMVGDRPWHIEGISRATWYRKLDMTKLDQLKALGDAKRAARKSSGGSRVRDNPRPHGESLQQGVATTSTISTAKISARRSRDAGNVAKPQTGPASAPLRSPPEAKRGRGRPKVEGPRPWEVAGVSRATWHRRRQCVICGNANYNLSCGGPSICPKCDCGSFDVSTVEKQAKVIAGLRGEVAALEERIEDLEGAAWDARCERGLMS